MHQTKMSYKLSEYVSLNVETFVSRAQKNRQF